MFFMKPSSFRGVSAELRWTFRILACNRAATKGVRMGSIQRIDPPKPWLARYSALPWPQHSNSFGRKIDAQKWLALEESKSMEGDWVDPSAGKLTYSEWS